jgi:hypothetical protein
MILVLVLGEVLDLLSRFIVVWQVVHPEETLLFGVVSFTCHEDVISSIFPVIQNDRKMTTDRMA